jgi:hypothetical protein
MPTLFAPTVDYAFRYPMTPLGGLFFIAIGVFVVLGALIPRWRMTVLWIGFGAAMIALVVGRRFAKGLPQPGVLPVAALVLAIVLEIVAFRVLIPRLRLRGERALLDGSLAIVGVHFLVMVPSFGPLVGVLGILCLSNAALAWRFVSYPIGHAWFVDGLMKTALGGAMLFTSPMFH